MSAYEDVQIIVPGATFPTKLFQRKTNDFKWEETPIEFLTKPASNIEKKDYRITQGVQGGSDSIYLITGNLPQDIKIGDHVEFIGKSWTVTSIGYYFDAAKFVNASLFSDEYIIARCPKGITLA